MNEFLESLNEKQYEAVTSTSQYLRIVAGAGSGKTRVLTYRIAYLIKNLEVSPDQILAITFTNKAAGEMRKRAIKLIADSYTGKIDIMTYHRFCAQFLRKEIHNIGFTPNYVILDEEDQERIIKEIASSKGLKKSDTIVSNSLNFIAHFKGLGKYPNDINIKNIGFRFTEPEKCLEFYQLYENVKSAMNALDFDDLIIKTIQILTLFPEVREKWSSSYSHILIDEFQDTNDQQYQIVKLLLTPKTSLYVVGDPDQTIYTWRGANQKIIMDLEKEYKDLKTIILDVNYRSTQQILTAANKLIAHNKFRIPKDLITNNENGAEVTIIRGFRQSDEAKLVVDKIKELRDSDRNFSYNDAAILFRSAYVSRPFEIELMHNRIPYVLYGGLRFYQRKEIKDCLAYFRLTINPDDDFSFLRIINEPKRGVGEVTLSRIKEFTHDNKISIYQLFKNYDLYDVEGIPLSVVKAVQSLIMAIDKARTRIVEGLEFIPAILKDFIENVNYEDAIMDDEHYEERQQNINSLFDDLKSYFKENEDASLDSYLQNVALLSAADEVKNNNTLKMMTVHTAKGLEFKYVFIVFFLDGVFPNNRSVMENPVYGMEEERRLAYVAFTRAMHHLYISYNTDFSFVTTHEGSASPFLEEAGLKVKEYGSRPNTTIKNPSSRLDYSKDGHKSIFDTKLNIKNNINWKVGDYLSHTKFGNGTVIEIVGDILKVKFDNGETKMLLASHPMLSKLDSNKGQA